MGDRGVKGVSPIERASICFPVAGSKTTLHCGDSDFESVTSQHFRAVENNALESVVALKAKAFDLSDDEFFPFVTEAFADILGADMSFIMKRILADEQDAAVEMPPFGEPGSCMMATAFHYTMTDGSKHTMSDCKLEAYSCPCAFMRHDKVALIPADFNDVITDNPNSLPMPAEAYIALPIFSERKCVGHFGCMWSREAAEKRSLSWAFIELVLHSLEDIITERLFKGTNLGLSSTAVRDRSRVIPHEVVTSQQSLRPYAGSLSHELRTPMQGVVGMLDIMYATVQEAVESLDNQNLLEVLASLKDNIEVVQDSSRRAVEAADNVVHAYDMDMTVPDGPTDLSQEVLDGMASPHDHIAAERPEILVSGSSLPIPRASKRRRDDLSSRPGSNLSTPFKFQKLDSASSVWSRASGSGQDSEQPSRTQSDAQEQVQETVESESNEVTQATRSIAPGLRHTSMHEVFKHVIDEGLKLGGRPDTIVATETTNGESIEVRSRGSDGTLSTQIITWNVDTSVPATMFIDEKDLSKLVSCVFLNAIKFADQQEGYVNINAKASSRGRYIVITIDDNGPGVPSAFIPKLFKPFSQENRSITRQSDGLGLGLMVAKGIARKLGGELSITKAETAGQARGSEFEIKVPLIAGETISRPPSPHGSPYPRASTLARIETPITSIPTDDMTGSIQFTTTLHHALNAPPLRCSNLLRRSTTPPSPRDCGLPTGGLPNTSSPPTASLSSDTTTSQPQPRPRRMISTSKIDRNLAANCPLSFLVAEDNKINRRLLVSMLTKLGYKNIYEAHDGMEAVRQMSMARRKNANIDVVLMDLWMPLMDGYEATSQILRSTDGTTHKPPTVLAVTADVTDGALERAAQVGMTGFMTKPYKLLDLQRLIVEYCACSGGAGTVHA